MREIPLTKGYVAIVSDEDYENLSKFKWCYHSRGYAYRGVWITERKNNAAVLMHRQILSAPEGLTVDHRNGNKLDNRRENIRLCTYSENNHNKVRSDKSGAWLSYGKWIARFMHEGKQIYRGSFTTQEEAIKAYQNAREQFVGEFVRKGSFN